MIENSSNSFVSDNTATDMMFYSVINDTEADMESKVMDNNFMENSNNMESSIITGTKRKRVRKRKTKNKEHSFFMSPLAEVEDSKPKKPKVVDNIIIPTAKHIRFDSMESNENSIAKKIVHEASDSYIARISSSDDLSALLALGKSSTPMFVKKKIKKEVNTVDSASSDETSNKNSYKTEENNASMERSTCEINRKGYYKNIEIEKIPIMTRKPQVKDIIVFKVRISDSFIPIKIGYHKYRNK